MILSNFITIHKMGNTTLKLTNVVISKGRFFVNLNIKAQVESGTNVSFEVKDLYIDEVGQYYFEVDKIKYIFDPFAATIKGIKTIITGNQVKWYPETLEPKFISTRTGEEMTLEGLEEESLL